MFDLEVWLIGTPTELDTVTAALGGLGRIVGASKPDPLYGADAGRVRRYLRVHIPYQATGNRPQPKAAGASQSPLALPDAA